jgi:hypothetical protein
MAIVKDNGGAMEIRTSKWSQRDLLAIASEPVMNSQARNDPTLTEQHVLGDGLYATIMDQLSAEIYMVCTDLAVFLVQIRPLGIRGPWRESQIGTYRPPGR